MALTNFYCMLVVNYMGPISTGANYVGNKLAEDKRDGKIKYVRRLYIS
jgi:hypothetical protein